MGGPLAWTAAAASTEVKDETKKAYEDLSEVGAGADDAPDKTSHRLEEVMGGADGEVKIGLMQAGIIFFKSCFGVGILGMPFAFRNSGITAGVMGLIFIALATNVATKMLIWIKRDIQKSKGILVTSIPEMAGVLMGKRGQTSTNVLVLACQLGTCIAYNIFLSISLTAIVESLMPESSMQRAGYDPYVFFIVCQVLLFSLMVQMKEMATLAPLLIFAQFAMVIAVGIIIGNGLFNPSVCDRDGSERILCKVHAGLRPDTFAIYVGIAVFAMEGIPTILAIENSLAEPDRFEEMFDRAQTLLTMVFLLFGTGGYWLYGNNTRSVVTLNVPGFTGVTVKMLMVAVIFCSYPLQFVPISQVAQSYVQGNMMQRGIARFWEWLPEWVVTANIFGKSQLDFSQRVWGMTKIVAVIITGVVAAVVPHFGHVLSLMGCCTFSTITFVLPPIMFLLSRQGQHQFQNVIICCLLMLFGALVTVVGLYGNMTSETVWHHKIEKAPPLAGSAEAKQARAVFKTAAGEIKHDPYIYPAAHGTLSPQLAKRGKATVSPPSATDANGWVSPAASNSQRATGEHKHGAVKVNDLNAKHKFYRDAEAVAKMEGMVKNTAAWHAIVPPKWKGMAADKAAAAKKLMELKKTRQANGGLAGSWVKVDSKYIASAAPAAESAVMGQQQPHAIYSPPSSSQAPTLAPDEEPTAVIRGTRREHTDHYRVGHGGSEAPATGQTWHTGQQQEQQRGHASAPGQGIRYNDNYQAIPPGQQRRYGSASEEEHGEPRYGSSQQEKGQFGEVERHQEEQHGQYVNGQKAAGQPQQVEGGRGWVPREQAGGSRIQRHESPLEHAQHELAIEKYKNALLREKEAEKEMKATEYRRHETTRVRQQFPSSSQSRGRPAVPPPRISRTGAAYLPRQAPVVARAVAAPAGAAPLVKAVAVSGIDDWTRPRAPQPNFASTTTSASSSTAAASVEAPGSPSTLWGRPTSGTARRDRPVPLAHVHEQKSSLPVSAHSSEKDLNAWAEGKSLPPAAKPVAKGASDAAAESDPRKLAKWSEGGGVDRASEQMETAQRPRVRRSAGGDGSWKTGAQGEGLPAKGASTAPYNPFTQPPPISGPEAKLNW